MTHKPHCTITFILATAVVALVVCYRSLNRVEVLPIDRKQTVDEVLRAAYSGHINIEEMPGIIEAAKKGDQNSVYRLMIHYFVSGEHEKYQKWFKIHENLKP